MTTISLFVLLAVASSVFSATVPPELYSPLISSKVLATAQAQGGNPTQYPQNTDQGPLGAWQYYTADQWTSGFFPDLIYKLNVRAELCPSTVDKADWVELGRSWSTTLTTLEYSNHLQHDVGFVSYPFMSELVMYAKVLIFWSEIDSSYSLVILRTRLRRTRWNSMQSIWRIGLMLLSDVRGAGTRPIPQTSKCVFCLIWSRQVTDRGEGDH